MSDFSDNRRDTPTTHSTPPSGEQPLSTGYPRAMLAWRIAVFQIKLIADGLRDVLLVPISIIAGLVGIVRGGSDADKPFLDVLKLGRRTESWINLFEHHRGGTADELFSPLQQRVFDEIDKNPRIKNAGLQLGKQLDRVHKPQLTQTGDNPFKAPDENGR